MSHILVVEDDLSQRLFLTKMLENSLGFSCVGAGNGAEALFRIKADSEEQISAVLLDLNMPEMDGKTTLPKIKALRPNLPVIILTASEDMSDAVEMMKRGASDFMSKPAKKERLRVSLANALKLHKLEEELGRLQRQREGKTLFSDLIGHTQGLRNTVKLAERAAGSDVTVMLAGEGGTGKELLMHAIHGESTRGGKPFIMVNCGTLTDEASALRNLFGARIRTKKGDMKNIPGAFAKAAEGTLCLDEVGELTMEAQTALFYALERRSYLPAGAEDRLPVNSRIIATSSQNLEALVQSGHFREDLFYRLHVFPIHVPSLRQRREDIEELADFFLRRHAAQESKNITEFDGPARRWMSTHDWLGNVRELENAVYRAVLLCDEDKIALEHITPFRYGSGGMSATTEETSLPRVHHADKIHLLDEAGAIRPLEAIKREAMDKAWAHCGNNIVKACAALGIGKSTFYRKRSEET